MKKTMLCIVSFAASLQQMRGKRVILSFWSAADAQSRMEQNRIDAMARKAVSLHKDVEVLSVNFDRSERLMDEIVSYDNLDHVGTPDDAAAVRDAFQLHNGLRTFIIDEQGKIICADPTEAQLLEALG